MNPLYPQTLASQQAAGTLFNTYTTAKSVINQTELVQLQPNFLSVIGSKLKVRVWGATSNIVTTPGTITLQVMLGSIAVWSSGAIQFTTTANTLTPFLLDLELHVRTVGTSTAATMWGGAELSGLNFTIGSGANPTVSDTGVVVPVAAPAAGTGFDSTVTNTLDFWAGFSISNAGNGIQIQDYTVTALRY